MDFEKVINQNKEREKMRQQHDENKKSKTTHTFFHDGFRQPPDADKTKEHLLYILMVLCMGFRPNLDVLFV